MMKSKKIALLGRGLVLTAGLFLIIACAGGVQVTKEDRAAIQSVSIDKDVMLPEEPYIQGGNARMAFLLLGGIGVAAEGKSAGQAFKLYMEKNNIDLAKIVVASFEENIKKDNILTLREDGRFKLKLKVNGYGYGESRFLGLVTPKVYRKPLMNITATLVNAENKIIWQKTAYLTPQSDQTTEYTFEDLVEKPDKTTESLTQITRLITAEVMDDFRKN
jgi:hypothetical protein